MPPGGCLATPGTTTQVRIFSGVPTLSSSTRGIPPLLGVFDELGGYDGLPAWGARMRRRVSPCDTTDTFSPFAFLRVFGFLPYGEGGLFL